jgi:hypothetical protein
MSTFKHVEERREGVMDLRLTDTEASAVKHALENYLKSLEASDQKLGIQLEEDAVNCVIQKMQSVSGAPGT